jgi:putative phosphoesterase
MRIGVIADTHGFYDAAIEEHFAGATEIFHAGDIGGRGVIERLTKIAPVVAVSGNVDEFEKSGFPRQVTIRRGGMKIAIRHVLYEKGKLTKEAQAWLDREQPAVCVFGHSHRPTIEQYGPTILFNPGSAGPKRFSLPRGIGLLILEKEKIVPRFVRLEDKASRYPARPSTKRFRKKGGTR